MNQFKRYTPAHPADCSCDECGERAFEREQSKTPRTDAAVKDWRQPATIASLAELTRNLERDRADLRAALAAMVDCEYGTSEAVTAGRKARALLARVPE